MTNFIKSADLCTNCSNAEGCSYRINQTKTIIFCEEFSCDGPLDRQCSVAHLCTKTDCQEHSAPDICSNCENNNTCGMRKAGVDVINCEEYR